MYVLIGPVIQFQSKLRLCLISKCQSDLFYRHIYEVSILILYSNFLARLEKKESGYFLQPTHPSIHHVKTQESSDSN